MKRALVLLLILVVLVAWWAVSNQQPGITISAEASAPAPYPADFESRLRRVGGLQLELMAPLPDEICWQVPDTSEALGVPGAVKGGCVRMPNAGPFPAHFLRFGGGAPQFFHQNLHAATEIPLLFRHPLKGEIYAGVAQAWAERSNTIYLQLNPKAHYNNGRPIRAADYLLSVLLQAEQGCGELETLSRLITRLTAHGSHILSVTLQDNACLWDAIAQLHPAEPGFYKDFDTRFRETYAQRIPPSTGAYRVSRVERGRLIQLQRQSQWWGTELPLCRQRFNADTLEYHFLSSEAQVWEFLRQGKLDALQTRNIKAWQEHAETNQGLSTLVYDADCPLPPYGIALNTLTLPDQELRKGLLQALDMDYALAIMMRGEGRRLETFSSGYGPLTPQKTPQYHYAPDAARSHFARAGYTQTGEDGILRRQDGTRLSVRLLYTPHEKINTLVTSLASSAARCGAEIIPEPVPWQICQQRLQERSHQLAFWAMPAPARPQPALFLSPDSEPGANPFALNHAVMNQALHQFSQSPTPAALAEIDRLVYELAIWLPGWKENRVYLAFQSHLCVPPVPWCFDALEAHTFWVVPRP